MLDNNDNNERRKKTITVTIIGVIVLLIALITVTYAWFSARSEATPQPITTAKVDLLVEIPEETKHIKDIKPTTWDNNIETNKLNNDIAQIPITVTNNSNIDINYDLFITPNGLSLKSEDEEGNKLEGGELKDIKYKLYETTSGVESPKLVTEGTFSGGNARLKVVNNKEIKKLEEGKQDNIQKYMLYIYIENKDEAQNKLQGLDFNIDIEGVTPSEKIAQTILKNEKEKGNIKTDLPQFTEDSTDKGLYKLQGDIASASISSEDSETNKKSSIYYYRGSVGDNYVQFGTYTKEVQNEVWNDSDYTQETVAAKGDPILWRIVRINEDGSVKLIAEHNIGLKELWNSKALNLNYESSSIKETVYNWYTETFDNSEEGCEECQSNMELASLIQDTEFCNDRQDLTSSDSAVLTRLSKTPPEPTLKCARDEDKVIAKAGLISADEMVYAGAVYNKAVTNNTTYLNNNTDFWTISPGWSCIPITWRPSYLFLSPGLNKVSNIDKSAVRPVITLSSEASFTSGSGTSTDPWILSE